MGGLAGESMEGFESDRGESGGDEKKQLTEFTDVRQWRIYGECDENGNNFCEGDA